MGYSVSTLNTIIIRLTLIKKQSLGVDVPGPGHPLFTNPTGGEERGPDDWGSGNFLASRAGEARPHTGSDTLGEAGDLVVAPIIGHLSNISRGCKNYREIQ